MAPLRYAAKFDPFLSLDCALPTTGAIQGKEGIKFCHLATLVNRCERVPREKCEDVFRSAPFKRCREVVRRDCEVVLERECRPVQREACAEVEQPAKVEQKCRTVPREECQVPNVAQYPINWLKQR